MTTTPPKPDRLLGTNREFSLLWVGQAVSSLGSTATLVAYPLLALAITHSPTQVGLVMSVGIVARLLVGLPGGALVDRVDKRQLMLVCDLARALAQAGLVVGIVGDRAGIWLLLAVVAIDNAFGAVFSAAEDPAVRHVVRQDQLPLALARNEARGAGAMLLGPPLGGLLYAIDPGLPFVANVVSYLVSSGCIALIRTTMPATPGGRSTVGHDMLEGIRFLLRRPFFRVTLLLISGLNLASNALVVLAIVASGQRGDAAPATGLLVTFASVGTLIGALFAPRLVHRFSLRTILIANRGIWVLVIPLLVFVENPYAVGGLLAVLYLIGPTGSTAVTTSQMAVTPDELQGRVSSARGFCVGLAAPIGSALIGFGLDQVGRTGSVLALTFWMTVLTAIALASKALRRPSA